MTDPPLMQIVRLLPQLGILWGICFVCKVLVAWLDLPVPANILGVVVLFGLLGLGVVKLEHVERVADCRRDSPDA